MEGSSSPADTMQATVTRARQLLLTINTTPSRGTEAHTSMTYTMAMTVMMTRGHRNYSTTVITSVARIAEASAVGVADAVGGTRE